MIEGRFLAEALEAGEPQYVRGRVNLFEAHTGQGKTTAAIKSIPAQLKLDPTRCLILIDSVMGRDEKVQMGLCQSWGECRPDMPYIMTYAKFGALIQRKEIGPQMFDYIACDEIHNLIKYVRIDEAAIRKRNPHTEYDVLCLILSRESLNYVAVDAILRWCKLGLWTFAFTATPGSLSKWTKLAEYINNIQLNEQLVAYQVFEKYEYTNIHVLLAENPATKRLIHAPTIELAQSFADEIKENTNRNAVVLWSPSNIKKMSDEQLAVVDKLRRDHVYPAGVDDIIATEAYSTGWNLNDPTVDEVIVHSGNADIQIQFPGRKRGDWMRQWNYNSGKADKEKALENRKKNRAEIRAREIKQASWVVPEEYLNRKLTQEDKEKLIAALGYPKKWTSLKKELEKEYVVEQKGAGKYYGHIIRKK